MCRKRYRDIDEKVYRYQPKDLYLSHKRYRSIFDWHYELQKKGTELYPEAELFRSGAAQKGADFSFVCLERLS